MNEYTVPLMMVAISTLPGLAVVYVLWRAIRDVEDAAPMPLPRESTQRTSGPLCAACTDDCFTGTLLCLCRCHDGRVPDDKLASRDMLLAMFAEPGDDTHAENPGQAPAAGQQPPQPPA